MAQSRGNRSFTVFLILRCETYEFHRENRRIDTVVIGQALFGRLGSIRALSECVVGIPPDMGIVTMGVIQHECQGRVAVTVHRARGKSQSGSIVGRIRKQPLLEVEELVTGIIFAEVTVIHINRTRIICYSGLEMADELFPRLIVNSDSGKRVICSLSKSLDEIERRSVIVRNDGRTVRHRKIVAVRSQAVSVGFDVKLQREYRTGHTGRNQNTYLFSLARLFHHILLNAIDLHSLTRRGLDNHITRHISTIKGTEHTNCHRTLIGKVVVRIYI